MSSQTRQATRGRLCHGQRNSCDLSPGTSHTGSRWTVLLSGVALTLTLAAFSPFARAERPSAPYLLPENTLAMLQVPDSREFVAKFREGSLGRMLEDEQIRPLASQLYGTVAEAFGKVQDQVGLPLDKILSIPQGELCLAVVPPKEGRPVVVFLLDAADQIDSVQRLLERGKAEMEKRGAVKTTEAVGDVLLEHWQPAGNQPSVTFGVREGTLLVTTDKEMAKSLLAAWNGTAPEGELRLADNKEFTAIMSRCGAAGGERPHFQWYVDPIDLFRVGARGNIAAQTGLAIFPALGLDGLQGIGGSLILGTGEFEMVQHVHLLLDSPRGGVLKALTLGAGDSTPEPWTPADVAVYMTVHWDFATTYREVSQLVDSFQTEGTFAGLAKRRVGEPLGVDFESELLAAFEGRATYINWFEKPARLNSQSQLIGARLKDAAAFRMTLDKIIAKYEKRFEKDSFGGVTFHRVVVSEEERRRRAEALQGQPVGQLGLREPEPCLAILGDYLVATDSVTLLKRCITTQSDPERSLANQLDYKIIASKAARQAGGAKPGLLMFNRPEEQMRQMYDLAQGDGARQALATQARNNPFFQSVEKALQDNPLPPFSVFSKYLAPGGGIVTNDETGFHYTAFGLKRN